MHLPGDDWKCKGSDTTGTNDDVTCSPIVDGHVRTRDRYLPAGHIFKMSRVMRGGVWESTAVRMTNVLENTSRCGTQEEYLPR